MDAIICNFKVRYLDPVAICESLHAGPKWMKDDDDYCWHLLTQTDKSASEWMPLQLSHKTIPGYRIYPQGSNG